MSAADDELRVARVPPVGTAPAPPTHAGTVADAAPLDVDEVSKLSFPASDPPSSGPGLV